MSPRPARSRVAAGAGLVRHSSGATAAALVTLVLLVGVIQMLAGLFRLGFIVRFVSNSVMTGFLNGLAVLIILGQLGELTGFRSRFDNNVARALDLMLRLDQVDIPTTIIGGLTLAADRAAAAHAPAQFRLHHRHRRSPRSCWDLDLSALGAALAWQAVRRSATLPPSHARCPP